ncbi:TonB-dependent receptor [Gayadomonas joobiniege]|uniref:TonB-dependent receptor n=1 Tax=Gayadomonas joobiniege TaxID=1234606 RepID=UPI00037D92DA|nr:TonB-dependent receptor [Gayadomonas joobiniege]
MQKKNKILVLSALSFWISVSVQAQSKNDTSELEVIEVYGSASSALINQKDAVVDGPFGANLNALEIPRALTSLSSETMSQLNITDLHDVLAVTPNSYSASGFGNPSLPSLRGQLGDLFQDGMRRQAGNNGFGVPISFNAIEQLDIVKGPAPVLLGTTQRNGGFVNLISKKAHLNQSFGQFNFTAARWDQYTAQLDYSHAFMPGEQALRVSYEHQDKGSFYDHSAFYSNSFYIAYANQLDADTIWNLNFEYYDVDYTDNAGINRPTQKLIDDGLYIQGQGRQSNGSLVPGAGAVISPTGIVKIARDNVYTHPDDINDASTYLLHSDYKTVLENGLAFRNLSYFQYLTREEIANNSFVEIIDAAYTFENRSEIDWLWDDKNTSTFALDIRYNDVLGYSQFTTEADNPVDLTGPLSNREIALTETQINRLIQLRPGVYVSPGGQYDLDNDGSGDFSLSDTTDSRSLQIGLVWQHQSRLSEKLKLDLGYRSDFYDVDAKDPIAPDGASAVSDSTQEWLQSYQASLSYQISQSFNSYLSYSHNDSTSNSMAGGHSLGADNLISRQNFATENELFEVGFKYAPENTNWYLDAALFEQTRSLRNRDGSNTGIITQGAEAQLWYTHENYWFNLSYSYLDARYDDSTSAQGTRQVADAFDNSRPDIIQGTSQGSPAYTVFAASNNKVQGLPPQMLGLNGGYWVTDNWQVGASAVYTKSYPLDYLATVQIRDQHSLNLNSQYKITAQSSVRVDVINATDQDNWQPVFEGGYFGATLVMPNEPVHAKISYQHIF